MRFFSGKISIFRVKIYDDLFLVIDLVFWIFLFFSHIFRMYNMLNVVHHPFLTRKTHFFYSIHTCTFTRIRQHYFSKYWGDQCMGRPPHLKLWGVSPPRPPSASAPRLPSP